MFTPENAVVVVSEDCGMTRLQHATCFQAGFLLQERYTTTTVSFSPKRVGEGNGMLHVSPSREVYGSKIMNSGWI
jgi:hypothetical protein